MSTKDDQVNNPDATADTADRDEVSESNGMSRRTFLKEAGVLSGSAVVLAGGSGRAAELLTRPSGVRRASKVTNIDIWSWNTEDEPLWPSLQKEFHEAYPSLTVTPRTFGTLAEFSPVLESAVAAGSAPDIFAPATLAISYGLSDITIDMKTLFSSSFLEGFFPSVNAMFSDNNKQYGIGWEAQMFGLFYNPEILAKAGVDFPETWDDLIEITPIIKKKAGVEVVATTGDPSNAFADFFLPLITQASNDPALCLSLDRLTQKGLTWNIKPVVEAFALIKKLVDAGVFPAGTTSITDTEMLALFYTGKSAFMWGGSFYVPSFVTSASKAFNKLYKVGQQPAWASGAKHWSGNQCGAGWAINAKSPNIEAAGTLLKWLYEPDRYATIMNQSNSMAATQSAAAKGDNPIVREMASWITENGCDHILFGVGSFTAASDTAAEVFGGKISPTAAAAQMQASVTQSRSV